MVFEDRNSPGYRPGEPVSLTEVRELDRLVRDMASATMTGPATFAGSPRDSIAVPPPLGFWARITGQTSVSQALYSFIPVLANATGDGWVTAANAISPGQQAFETSGNTAVPADPTTGAVVWIEPSEANGGESWRFTWTADVALVQVNAGVPDGSGHYDASVLGVDPATGLATVHESCWFVAPGTTSLPAGSTFLGRFTGTYSSRNVYVNHGPLITELDSGTHRIPTTFLDLHDPTFLPPDELIAGSGHARVRLNWGTNIQPVGTHNLPGVSEQPARADHVHAFAVPATTDPPGDTTGTTNIYNTATNTLWVYVTGIGWVPICPCPGWNPPFLSGSGSGSGTGVGGGGGVVTECCAGAPIPNTLYLALTPGSLAGCECLTPPEIPIVYQPGQSSWRAFGVALCGVTCDIYYNCYDGTSWQLQILGPAGTVGTTDVPASCDPFLWPESSLVEIDFSGSGVCLGSGKPSISE